MSFSASSQERYWIPYWNKDSTLFGYATEKGEIKIKAKFADFAIAHGFDNFTPKFEHIVPVGEGKGEEYKSYYLSKSGKQFGHDSIHYSFSVSGLEDCESEDYIRFTSKNGLVGLFDKEGKIVIPSIYNRLSKVKNGHVWALKNARRVYDMYDPDKFKFVDGEQLLLNTTGDIVIKNFKYKTYAQTLDGLDIFTMSIGAEKSLDSTKFSFLGTNGSYYTFSDYYLEFKVWLNQNFINNLTRKSFRNMLTDSLAYRDVSATSTSDIINSFETLKHKHDFSQPTVSWGVSMWEINPMIYDRIYYSKYFDNCGNPKSQYPVMLLIVEVNESNRYVYRFLKLEEDHYMLMGLPFAQKD